MNDGGSVVQVGYKECIDGALGMWNIRGTMSEL